MNFSSILKRSIVALAAIPVAGAVIWFNQSEADSSYSWVAADTSGPTECTYDAYGRTADGASFWNMTEQGIPGESIPDTNCLLDQFAMNNFLYLVGDDGSGHPRFMSYAPWYDMLPESGSPSWPGGYSSLNAGQFRNIANLEEAGDGFELMDVNSQFTAYDIRVNKAFFNYVAANNLYTKTGLDAAVAAFNANSYSGGIWLPPTDADGSKPGATEIKTSWRPYGPSSNGACPSDIMHCEVDDEGNSWGLVGFHLVQKTTGHGEFIWSTFEHVGNAPDCVSGGSNPIAQNPADPVHPGQTLNMNRNISGLSGKTGWNYFNYASYIAAGGTNQLCTYPGLLNGTQPICLTTPEGEAAGDWVQVNVCRTQSLPTGSDVCTDSAPGVDNAKAIACLNQSTRSNFPSGMAAKWKYYELVGMEWLMNGATGNGALTQGCFTYDENDAADACPNYPNAGKGGELGVPHYARVGSTQMANTTMETWMQAGMTLNSKRQGVITANDCFACHQPQTRSYQGDMSHIFGRVSQP